MNRKGAFRFAQTWRWRGRRANRRGRRSDYEARQRLGLRTIPGRAFSASIHQRYQSELRVGTELPDSGCRSWSNLSQSAARILKVHGSAKATVRCSTPFRNVNSYSNNCLLSNFGIGAETPNENGFVMLEPIRYSEISTQVLTKRRILWREFL